MKIVVGNMDNYSKVDASVGIVDLSAGPFGDAKGSFLSHSVNYTGKGRHTLRARLSVGESDRVRHHSAAPQRIHCPSTHITGSR